jgi:hypothetical protein
MAPVIAPNIVKFFHQLLQIIALLNAPLIVQNIAPTSAEYSYNYCNNYCINHCIKYKAQNISPLIASA